MAVTSRDKPTKVEFLVPVKHGFKLDTEGFEGTKDADGNDVATVKHFNEGDEFTFPAAEADAARALVEDGLAVLAKDTKANEQPVQQ